MDNCSCVYVDLDEVQPDFFSQRTPTARKPHKCHECHRDILSGEKYEYVIGKWEGEFNTWKTCSDCLSIRKSFFCEGYYFGGLFECLYEHILDMNGEISSDCLTPLTKVARDKVCDMIEEVWQD